MRQNICDFPTPERVNKKGFAAQPCQRIKLGKVAQMAAYAKVSCRASDGIGFSASFKLWYTPAGRSVSPSSRFPAMETAVTTPTPHDFQFVNPLLFLRGSARPFRHRFREIGVRETFSLVAHVTTRHFAANYSRNGMSRKKQSHDQSNTSRFGRRDG